MDRNDFQPMPKRFMVWDTKEKKFLGKQDWVILPTLPDYGVTIPQDDTSLTFADEQVIDWADTDLLTGRYLICQSTNLFDKDGKEIFEGSIVESPEWRDDPEFDFSNKVHPPERAIVEYRRGGWIGVGGWDLRYCKVIGHILTNPELLEEEGAEK